MSLWMLSTVRLVSGAIYDALGPAAVFVACAGARAGDADYDCGNCSWYIRSLAEANQVNLRCAMRSCS
jgi:hypothetical protein